MTSTDSHSLIVVDSTDKVQDVIVVIKVALRYPLQRYGLHVHLVHVHQNIFWTNINLRNDFTVIEVTLLLDQA